MPKTARQTSPGLISPKRRWGERREVPQQRACPCHRVFANGLLQETPQLTLGPRFARLPHLAKPACPIDDWRQPQFSKAERAGPTPGRGKPRRRVFTRQQHGLIQAGAPERGEDPKRLPALVPNRRWLKQQASIEALGEQTSRTQLRLHFPVTGDGGGLIPAIPENGRSA